MLKKTYKTPQEEFWAGNFGNEYIDRNTYENLVPKNVYEWSKMIDKTAGIKSCIEFGANIGANLKAIEILLPKTEAKQLKFLRIMIPTLQL